MVVFSSLLDLETYDQKDHLHIIEEMNMIYTSLQK